MICGVQTKLRRVMHSKTLEKEQRGGTRIHIALEADPDARPGKIHVARIAVALLSGLWSAVQYQAEVVGMNHVQNRGYALGGSFHAWLVLPFDHLCRKGDNCLLILREGGLDV